MSDGTNQRNTLEDLAALAALDLLDDDDARRYAELRAAASDVSRAELGEYDDVAVGIALSVPPIDPPATVRDALMRSIASGPMRHIAANQDWLPHAVPGVSYKTLNLAGDRATVIARMEPGSSFPTHEHARDEECYVVSGSLVGSELTLREGDYLRAGRGTSHGPLSAPEGCVLFLVLSREDYAAFTGSAS